MQNHMKALGLTGKQEKVSVGPFYIDRYEVTNARYRRFVAEVKDEKHKPFMKYRESSYNIGGGGRVKSYSLWDDKRRNRDEQPVTCVSEKDIEAYARWAGKSIPTRAHWEHAAFADGKRIFPWGSDFDAAWCRCDIADFRKRQRGGLMKILTEEYSEMKHGRIPFTVGSFPKDRSACGCYDVAGNVSEWVKIARGEYQAAGGNANSLSLEDLIDVRSPQSLMHSYLMVGFRTILVLEARKPEPGQLRGGPSSSSASA